MMGRNVMIYGLYDSRDNDILVLLGSASELSALMGVTPREIRRCVYTKHRINRIFKVEKIGSSEEI